MSSPLYYSIYFIVLLAIEIVIALFIHDTIIRPVGDVLAVILVYCFLSIFLEEKRYSISILALLIAIFLETLQYTFHHSLDVLPYFFRVVLGSTFDRGDIAMYFLGFLVCLILRK